MIVLGIETSCDETAVGIVKDGKTLLANAVFSSMDLHKAYGGVVPEIAARSHIESIVPVIEQALEQAFGPAHKKEARNTKHETNQKSETPNAQISNDKSMSNDQCQMSNHDHWSHIDAIAVTYGAGLGGSLLVGVMAARTLAIAKDKPLYAINHVEAHVYANFLIEVGIHSKPEIRNTKQVLSTQKSKIKTATHQLGQQTYQLPATTPQFPVLALIVSGGHTQLVLFRDHFDYTLLGQTRDDAIGEAFDKVAKIIGLPYPGGPSVANAAKGGDAHRYALPKSKLDGDNAMLEQLRSRNPKSEIRNPKNYDFSFSGVKTAVLRLAQDEIGEDFTFPSIKIADRLSEAQRNDIAASFQRVAIETVVDKAMLAYEEFQPKSVVIAGGVAASAELRKQLHDRFLALNSKYETQNPKQIQNLKSKNLIQAANNPSEMLNDKSMENGKWKMENPLHYTDVKLCTDNGAMIATLGCYKAMLRQPVADPYSLEINSNLSM